MSEEQRRSLDARFDEAERRIVRIAPSAFPGLPENLAKEMERLGCTIPQTYTLHPNNAVQGEYSKPGQKDWAVLCSIKGTSSILVFWNGSEKNPAELNPREDRNYLQSSSDNEIVYSRAISSVGRDLIMRHFEAYLNHLRLTTKELMTPSLKRVPKFNTFTREDGSS
jgi:hypothetical protein